MVGCWRGCAYLLLYVALAATPELSGAAVKISGTLPLHRPLPHGPLHRSFPPIMRDQADSSLNKKSRNYLHNDEGYRSFLLFVASPFKVSYNPPMAISTHSIALSPSSPASPSPPFSSTSRSRPREKVISSRLFYRSNPPKHEVTPEMVSIFEGGPDLSLPGDPFLASNKLPKGPLELTRANVEALLEDVRPYLQSDGGDCRVVKVADNKIYLQLQGACGTCPSSVVTVKMGIERRLKERIPSLESVETVNPEEGSSDADVLNAEGIEKILESIRPFLSVTGGDIDLVSLHNPPEGIGCKAVLQFVGKIGGGISLAIKSEIIARIKRRFPTLKDIVILDPPATRIGRRDQLEMRKKKST